MLTMVLIFLLLAIAMFALFAGAHQRGDQARLLRERLTAINRATQRNPRPELALLREEIASSIPALNQLLTKSALITRLQDWLAQAAIKMSASKFLLLCACVGAVLGVLASRFVNSSLIGLVVLFLGGCIPALVVSIKRKRRFSAFEAALPNAIDMIARAVRVGHAFNSCLEMIATEVRSPYPRCPAEPIRAHAHPGCPHSGHRNYVTARNWRQSGGNSGQTFIYYPRAL